jgi:glyoxylase-like metal-dependent hydrolase (beta-lactamase superfamily II)
MTAPLPFTPDLSVKPEVVAFFDEPTNTISYIVKDPNSDACAVVDSVMDIDYAAGRITYDGADAIIQHIKDNGWKLEWIIETHVHADHLSAAPYIQQKLGGKLGIGENITIVQNTFGKIFNEGTEFQRDGVTEDEFVRMREARDATLDMPKLIIPSLQVNMRAGQLPPRDESGKTYLKVPVNEL